MRKLLLLVSLLLSTLTYPAWAEDALTPEKTADIEQLLDMTGALALGQQMSAMMVGQFTNVIKQANPSVPNELFETLPGIVNSVIKENLPTFKQATILLYHRYYTREDIRGMIAFYSTDLGKKTVRIMPAMMQESMKAGQAWGQSLAPEIEHRIRERFKRDGVDI